MNTLKILNSVIDWFQPDESKIEKLSIGSHEGARLCRLNIITSLFSSLIILLMFVTRIHLEGIMSVTLYALLGASFVFILLPFIIKATANYQIANTTLVVVALIVLPIRVLETGGLNSAVMSWYFCACLAFFIIGSLRLGVIAYILSVVEICMLYIATKNGWGNTDFTSSLEVDFWVLTFALSLGIFIIYWYEKQRVANIKILEEKSQQISTDNGLLAQQKFELEKANLDKSTLLNVLSHDITNPLNIVMAYTEILKDEDPDNEILNNIDWAATVIMKIIDHARLLQETDIKTSGLQLSPVNLGKCFEQANFIFKNKLEQKDLILIFDKESLSQLDVLAEPVSLNNFVINNIISNAIKFSAKGSRIEISAYPQDEDIINLSIKDFGIGMSPKNTYNLFVINKISSRQGTQGETGTGLGMKIVSSYMKGYGGHVEVESISVEEDKDTHGTTFHLCFKKS